MGAEPSDSSSGSSPSRSTKGTLVPHFPPKATFSADLAADAGSSPPAAESPPARPQARRPPHSPRRSVRGHLAESASRRSKCSHKFKPKPDGSAALAIGCRSGDVTTPDVAPASRSLAPEAGPHRLEGESCFAGRRRGNARAVVSGSPG